jgi:hypothetical protein
VLLHRRLKFPAIQDKRLPTDIILIDSVRLSEADAISQQVVGLGWVDPNTLQAHVNTHLLSQRTQVPIRSIPNTQLRLSRPNLLYSTPPLLMISLTHQRRNSGQ